MAKKLMVRVTCKRRLPCAPVHRIAINTLLHARLKATARRSRRTLRDSSTSSCATMTKKQAAQHAAYLAAARQRPRCLRCFIVESGPRSTFRCALADCPKTFTPVSPIEICQREDAERAGDGASGRQDQEWTLKLPLRPMCLLPAGPADYR